MIERRARTRSPIADTKAKAMMDSSDCNLSGTRIADQPDSLFDRCSWFYALCREYLFRDHTAEIAASLFPVSGPDRGTHVLEIGCGPGFYSCRRAEGYPEGQTTGVDLSESQLIRAKLRAARRHLVNCDFRLADAHALPPSLGAVDAVIVSRLFLIVLEREGVLSEIHRILRPGGRCFIAEPTSGFRTRIPLSCMWLLSKLTSSPAGKYREPRQADVMSREAFSALIHSQPWSVAEVRYDGWYQYAVCQKEDQPAPADTLQSMERRCVPAEEVRA